ncbi:hypothetical protein FN846DRAFT_890026 [Sphaerosporella brunnea]|uniref:RanBP2-type domain-containing protein n=1 Tax=Sphaerosporella brunnea TaxID=1250544 RepID=A0A5J5EXE6_9PEZI|nr:hypothetical protein FN846DRAFT_890026 [Sphaerosporella brunnea]
MPKPTSKPNAATILAAKNASYAAELATASPLNIDIAALRYKLLNTATRTVQKPSKDTNHDWHRVMRTKVGKGRRKKDKDYSEEQQKRGEEEAQKEEEEKRWRWFCCKCAARNSCWLLECDRCEAAMCRKCEVLDLGPAEEATE